MTKHLLKTFVAMLAIAAAAAGPVRGQNSYNVTFGGFGNDQLNTMYEDQSLPLQLTFDAIDISEQLDGVNEAYVDDGAGAEEIGVTYGPGSVTVTINSAFNGTATIIVDDYGNYEAYLYVTVVSNAPAPTPHTVRFASGNDGWTMQDVTASASATAPAVLQNVMAGDSLVVTAPASLPGKVKSVKAVKYVAPALNTINVSGQTFYYATGENWGQAIANHPTENAGWSVSDGVVLYNGENAVVIESVSVYDSDSINPTGTYTFF